MPINERRRDDIATAVAAYDSANPNASLPRNAARPLAAMFPCETPMLSALAQAAQEGDLAAKVQAAGRPIPATAWRLPWRGWRAFLARDS
jgi:hypothetical protein